ncbi:MAG: MarR family transcriptional regulator [Methanoregulaceae archaeon]
MKDEDLDWQVYHLTLGTSAKSIAEITEATGQDDPAIRASAKRLASGFLVEVTGDLIRALPIQESLLRCQCKYDTSLPYTIENGVVTMKKER